MGRDRTKYQGVYQRQHSTRRHLGKPDICFDISYKTPAGKKVWEKVGWTSENYTAQMAAQVRAERMRSMRHGDIPQISRKKVMTFGEAFALFDKDWLFQVKTAPEDRRRYRTYLANPLEHMPLSSITPLDVERLKGRMAEKGYSAQTVRHAVGLVRRVYRKLADWDVYSGAIPTDKVSMPKVDAARTRYLTEKEARNLLDALKSKSGTWHDIAMMSLHTGMRLGEVLALRWEDLDLAEGHLHVRDAKAGSRIAYLSAEASTMLEERGPLPVGLVFPARGDAEKESFKASKTFFRIVEELGFNKGITDRRQRVVFHTLRHTFASWLAIKGTPLYVIGELLGHKTLEMTKRYSHLCPDVKKDAVALIGAMAPASKAEKAKRATHKSSSGKRCSKP